jgi:putative ABC transport system permease protein
MISSVFLIGKQVNYMKNHDLGLGINKEQIVAINLPFEADNFPGTEAIRQEFSSLPEIESIAFGGNGTNLGSTEHWLKSIMVVKDEQGNDVQFVANQPVVDENYIDLFGINLVEGRNFSATRPSDKESGVIVNETYVKKMGWQEPLGKPIFEDTDQKVIGVVEDFHFDALYNPIEPLMISMMNGQPAFLFASVKPQYLKAIQDHWENTFDDIPFEYSFIDQHFATLYDKNEKEMTIFSYLTIVAIFISCLGLYGLASHFTLNKTKEIGIRKVNGARVDEIMQLLNSGFVKWVAIAFVISVPLSFYAMSKWLENFAYKTELSWWIFALAGVMALGIALITVSWQSWKAATRNPVEVLRYE